MTEGISDEHAHGLGDMPPVVVDVELWTNGDAVYIRVMYSDGTSMDKMAPLPIGSGVA